MKKITVCLLALALCLSVCACGAKKDTGAPLTQLSLGAPLAKAQESEPALKEDGEGNYVCDKVVSGIEGTLKLVPVDGTVQKVLWNASLKKTKGNDAYDTLYRQLKAELGAPYPDIKMAGTDTDDGPCDIFGTTWEKDNCTVTLYYVYYQNSGEGQLQFVRAANLTE